MRSLFFVLCFCISAMCEAITPDWALYGVDGMGEFHNGRAYSYSTNTKKHGYIDAQGRKIIPDEYEMTFDFKLNYAIVKTTDDKYGIIDVNGNYTLTPGNYDIMALDKSRDEKSGFYRVRLKDTNKCALFNGQRFLTGFIYDYIDCSNSYPFVTLSIWGSESRSDLINVMTLETFQKAYVCEFANIGYVVTKDDSFTLYSYGGEPLNYEKHLVSTKGSEVFRDEETGLYGIRNSKSGNILVPARYRLTPRAQYYRMWVNDVVCLMDSISPKQPYASVVINEDGKEILRPTSTANGFMFESNWWIESYDSSDILNNSRKKYYDFTGKEITALSGDMWVPVNDKIFSRSSKNQLYFLESNRIIENVQYPQFFEGMIVYRNPENEQYYCINLATNNTYGPYESMGKFSEGLSKVSKQDSPYFFIDKNGREYHYPSTIEIEGDYFSEGVIRARDDEKSIYGYLYNPLGHSGWAYNQKGGSISDYAQSHLHDEAQALFDSKQYAQAMDLYSRLMMCRPDDSVAFNNYAVCLYNLGHYHEALAAIEVSLHHWPDNEYANNLKPKIVAAIEQENSFDEDDNSSNGSEASIWDALGNFANALAQISGGYTGGGYQSSGFGSYGSYSSGSSTGGGNYESMYRNWERRAESNYNSLTKSGYSSTSKSGKKSGSSGGSISSGNYVQMKRSLREAQNEMRNIRRKAKNAGINIPKSQWEDASVGY